MRPELAALIEIVKAQANTEKWKDQGGAFIPHPASWLNAAGWENDIASMNVVKSQSNGTSQSKNFHLPRIRRRNKKRNMKGYSKMENKLLIEKTDAQLENEKQERNRGIVAERMKAHGYDPERNQIDFAEVVDRIARAEASRRCVILSGGYGWENYAALIQNGIPSGEVEWLKNAIEFCAVNPLILLDDVGAETVDSNYGQAQDPFSKFILSWAAIMDGKPRLLITTNLNAAEMDKRYGARIMSRLTGICETYRMKGKDQRANQNCGECMTTLEVKSKLLDFQAIVSSFGKAFVYPQVFIFNESLSLATQEEKNALRFGVNQIMAGHDGCKLQNDPTRN